jgi:hypothetical protein
MSTEQPLAFDEDADVTSNVTPLPTVKRRDPRRDRVRMSGQERREQLLNVGRRLFAE